MFLLIDASETKRKTLEEVAAAFGDRVVDVAERDVETEEAVLGAKAEARHREVVSSSA